MANNWIEWTSGDIGAMAEWDFGTTSDGIHYHKVWKQNQQTFSEVSDRAEWGNWVSAAITCHCMLRV